jgi:hypothetical protein
MKIAVIVPGQWRTFSQAIELFHENVVKHTEADFEFYYRFKVSSEEHISLGGRPLNWEMIQSLTNDCRTKFTAIVPEEPLDHIEGTDRMWGYTHDKIKNHYWQSIKGQHDIYGVLKMNPNYPFYDMVVMLRTDYWFNEPLRLHTLDTKLLYIPDGEDHCDGYNDQCYWGNPVWMEKVCMRCTDYLLPDRARHPETALKEFCDRFEVPVVRHTINAGIGR